MTDAKPATGMPLPEAMAGNFQEAVRWFNQMWSAGMDPGAPGRSGAGAIPSMMMPTLDIHELDKRIADLRSVEQWLQLNQGLLRTTIQTLELQRNGLAAWQDLGAAAGRMAPSGTASAAADAGARAQASAAMGAAAGAAEAAAFQPALWWAALQQQFAQMAAGAMAGTAEPDPGKGTTATDAAAAPGSEPPPPAAANAPAPADGAPGKASGGKGKGGGAGRA